MEGERESVGGQESGRLGKHIQKDKDEGQEKRKKTKGKREKGKEEKGKKGAWRKQRVKKTKQ